MNIDLSGIATAHLGKLALLADYQLTHRSMLLPGEYELLDRLRRALLDELDSRPDKAGFVPDDNPSPYRERLDLDDEQRAAVEKVIADAEQQHFNPQLDGWLTERFPEAERIPRWDGGQSIVHGDDGGLPTLDFGEPS